jgi:Rrf2 family protein
MRRKIDYAIVLCNRLKQAGDAFVDLSVVAHESRLPYAFLEKVAQELKRTGLLESKRGAGGGYRLVKVYRNVSAGDIMNLFYRPYEVCPLLRGIKNHE